MGKYIEWFCSPQISNAIPSPYFSVAAELRMSDLPPNPKDLIQIFYVGGDLTVLKHPRHPSILDSLEERLSKAKSSRSLQPFNIFSHLKRNKVL
jgi:hypothetical protein